MEEWASRLAATPTRGCGVRPRCIHAPRRFIGARGPRLGRGCGAARPR